MQIQISDRFCLEQFYLKKILQHSKNQVQEMYLPLQHRSFKKLTTAPSPTSPGSAQPPQARPRHTGVEPGHQREK